MSKALADLTECEAEVVDRIAHCTVVQELSRRIDGAGDFADYYLDREPEAARIWQALKERVPEVKRDMALLMEESESEGEG